MRITIETENQTVVIEQKEITDEAAWTEVLPLFMRSLKGLGYIFEIGAELEVNEHHKFL